MDQAKILCSVDIHRDGGSLSLSCKCDDVFSVLFFEIDDDDEAVCDGPLKRRKYKKPRLEEYHSFQWTSKVGATIDDTLHSKLPVSWETARVILNELRSQIHGFSSDNLHLFDEMACIADREGTGLPR